MKLTAIAMHICEVEWTKILIERSITEFVVDVKKEGILDILGWLSVCNPVQFVYTKIKNG